MLGGGIDHVYPPEHDDLYSAIAAQGLIVSECPFGYRAGARDFPRRNRFISGMSRSVVVVEASERSGSLVTARMAGEQGGEVRAIPGSPLDPRAAGTNRLIRQGAALVTNAADVLECLGGLSLQGSFRAPQGDEFEADPDRDMPQPGQVAAVREALSPSPMPIDEIARAAGISIARCRAILMELELAGVAVTLPGGLAALSFE